MNNKVVTTAVTREQLIRAQGGRIPAGDVSLVMVVCPAYYDESTITPEDILYDGAITVWSEWGDCKQWSEVEWQDVLPPGGFWWNERQHKG